MLNNVLFKNLFKDLDEKCDVRPRDKEMTHHFLFVSLSVCVLVLPMPFFLASLLNIGAFLFEWKHRHYNVLVNRECGHLGILK